MLFLSVRLAELEVQWSNCGHLTITQEHREKSMQDLNIKTLNGAVSGGMAKVRLRILHGTAGQS